jgi:hypothetical protein
VPDGWTAATINAFCRTLPTLAEKIIENHTASTKPHYRLAGMAGDEASMT